jgi:hypothetical protein
MRDLVGVLAVGIGALGVVFAALALGDASTTVPPPESVAEQFARQIAARRYDRALEHVDPGSGITLITLRLGGDAFHARAEGVDRVEGEPGEIQGNTASASAVLFTGNAGRVRFTHRLARRHGVWEIVTWEID